MPLTTFLTMLLTVLAASGLTVWAMVKWGMLTILPVLVVIALTARWALAHVPLDDSKNAGTP
ncbi:MAG: hypothetical protein ACPG7W_08270 [Paracoccaceae bacterium]